MGTIIIGAGVVLGTMASSLTAESVVWHRPAHIQTWHSGAPVAAIDQTSAGQAWARSAFPGGLRRCPEVNPEFLAACQVEMKALLERPELATGSFGGPLLITKVVEPQPEPIGDSFDDRAPVPIEPVSYDSAEPMPQTIPEMTPENYPAMPEE